VTEDGAADDRTMTKTTLITGANKGLGREAARRLLAENHEVWLAARDDSRGQAAADALGARFVQLDVTDEDSVAARPIGVVADRDRLPASKTAVNMITTQYAKAFPQIRINAVDPGYTATDLNGHNGTQSVTEGTDAIVAMATVGPSGLTGTFVDRNGIVAW
jgi:NAD(P)-dependent dehydrogenase (short-subunit alcohol dehydrogenase family)